jgi:DeoR/GlpR family transcriptional regulator of sugar metabolism
VIVVADHSKWGVVSNFHVASIDEVDKFICDDRLDLPALELLADHGVSCLLVPAAASPA